MSVESTVYQSNDFRCYNCGEAVHDCCNCGNPLELGSKIWCAKTDGNLCNGYHFCSEDCAREAHAKAGKRIPLHCTKCGANLFK